MLSIMTINKSFTKTYQSFEQNGYLQGTPMSDKTKEVPELEKGYINTRSMGLASWNLVFRSTFNGQSMSIYRLDRQV